MILLFDTKEAFLALIRFTICPEQKENFSQILLNTFSVEFLNLRSFQRPSQSTDFFTFKLYFPAKFMSRKFRGTVVKQHDRLLSLVKCGLLLDGSTADTNRNIACSSFHPVLHITCLMKYLYFLTNAAQD